MRGVAVVIDCRFLLYLSGMALLEEELVRQKVMENAAHLTPSIKSAIKIIQLRDLNPAGLRVPAPIAQRQTQFTDNPYMIALTPLLGSNLFPLLTFSEYQGKREGNDLVILFT